MRGRKVEGISRLHSIEPEREKKGRGGWGYTIEGEKKRVTCQGVKTPKNAY